MNLPENLSVCPPFIGEYHKQHRDTDIFVESVPNAIVFGRHVSSEAV